MCAYVTKIFFEKKKYEDLVYSLELVRSITFEWLEQWRKTKLMLRRSFSIFKQKKNVVSNCLFLFVCACVCELLFDLMTIKTSIATKTPILLRVEFLNIFLFNPFFIQLHMSISTLTHIIFN